MQTNRNPQVVTKPAIVLLFAAAICSAQLQNVGAVGGGVSISFANASSPAGRGVAIGFLNAVGTIQVTTNLSAATFSLTGAANYSGSGTSFTQTNAPAGTYTITYGLVDGYQTPPSETKALAGASSISFNGTYHNLIGTISVSVQPSSATYKIAGPASFTGLGSATYNAIPAGQYTITYLPLTGYAIPSSETKTLLPGMAIAFAASYQLAAGTGSLQIQVTPGTAGYNVIGPSSFSGLGSKIYGGLPAGKYTITFLPLIGPGIVTPIPQTVLLPANQTILVTGTYLSSARPPTLAVTNGSVCLSPICVSTKVTDRGSTFVTADVTVTNVTGAWYQLDVQFDNATANAPNPILMDTSRIPTAFLIGPFKTITFPAVRFQAGQYFAMDAEKYSVASTSMLAIDIITRGLFGVEIDLSWSGILNLALADLRALASTTELGAPGAAVAFGLCTNNLCKISKLSDFVYKATQSPQVWKAVQSLVGKVFGPNAIQRWLDFGGKSFGELFGQILGVFTSVPKLAVLLDQTFSSPDFGGFRIEAAR